MKLSILIALLAIHPALLSAHDMTKCDENAVGYFKHTGVANQHHFFDLVSLSSKRVIQVFTLSESAASTTSQYKFQSPGVGLSEDVIAGVSYAKEVRKLRLRVSSGSSAATVSGCFHIGN